MKGKIIKGKKLEDWEKKYEDKDNLEILSKSQVEKDSSVLDNKKWWLIDNKYYQVPKKKWLIPIFAIFGAGIITAAVVTPIMCCNPKKLTVEIDDAHRDSAFIQSKEKKEDGTLVTVVKGKKENYELNGVTKILIGSYECKQEDYTWVKNSDGTISITIKKETLEKHPDLKIIITPLSEMILEYAKLDLILDSSWTDKATHLGVIKTTDIKVNGVKLDGTLVKENLVWGADYKLFAEGKEITDFGANGLRFDIIKSDYKLMVKSAINSATETDEETVNVRYTTTTYTGGSKDEVETLKDFGTDSEKQVQVQCTDAATNWVKSVIKVTKGVTDLKIDDYTITCEEDKPAKITLTDSGMSYLGDLVVEPELDTVKNITLNKSYMYIDQGEVDQTLEATITGSTTLEPTWTCSNPELLSIEPIAGTKKLKITNNNLNDPTTEVTITASITTSTGKIKSAVCTISIRNLLTFTNTGATDATLKFTPYRGKGTTSNAWLQYSTDKTNWTSFSSSGGSQTIASSGVLYLRGYVCNTSTIKNQILITGGEVTLSGNLMNLLGPTDSSETFEIGNKLYEYCFQKLFDGSTGINSIDNSNGKLLPIKELKNYCYYGMFNKCTALTNLPSNLLPATALAESCYREMFSECNGLTTLPAGLLPATDLTGAEYCYYKMFYNCSGLTSLPEGLLPATTLATSCYESMFHMYQSPGSVIPAPSITTLPKGLLPAKTLATSCYTRMFYNWNHLISLPEGLLPATTLAPNCYNYMFFQCTSLTTLPAGLFSATDLTGGNNCCSCMFEYCTGLTSLPEGLLPATTLASNCYEYMFSSCSAITTLSENLLPATTLAISCYKNMFSSCSAITTLPAGLLPAKILANNCYKNMFSNQYDCTGGLISLPADLLPATDLSGAEGCYQNMFYNCPNLTAIPFNLLPATKLSKNCYCCMFAHDYRATGGLTSLPVGLLHATDLSDAEGCYQQMFYSCKMLKSLPADFTLPATTLSKNCYNQMFYIDSQPNDDIFGLAGTLPLRLLPAEALAEGCYQQMFYNCRGLTSLPTHAEGEKGFLPATTLSKNCYNQMFYACGCASSGLTTVPLDLLPATDLSGAEGCYQQMFYDCEILTTAPNLPATTLSKNCYYQMFYKCYKISEVPELKATTLANSCYYQMFYNCTDLKISEGVPTGSYSTKGTIFTCPDLTELTNPVDSMFYGCKGTFASGTPTAGNTYYWYKE